MARLLVQLKLRLLTNALRSSTGAKVSFITSLVFAVLLAIGTFVVLAALRGQTAAVAQTAAVFTVFAFGWLILPLFSFGLDGTLDPATLALYPLRTRPLAVGLLAASATGAWPLANVLGLLGVTIGLAHGVLGELVAVLAVLLQVLFCIALARFVTTAMAGLLRSRRGRDLAVFLIIPIFALYEAFAQTVPRLAAEGKITAETFAGIDKWLRWLPPGLAAHAIQDASAGHAGTALLRLGLLAAVIVVLAGLWVRSLGRALVRVDTSTQSSAVRGRPLPFARSGIRGTVAGRYLIYQRRDPGSFVRWCIVAVVMGAASVSTVRTPHYHVALILSAVLGAWILGVYNANSIGLTGPAFGLEASALSGARALRGLPGRPWHRARHHRGAADDGGILRHRGRRRPPGGRFLGGGHRSRGHRRGPGSQQHLQREPWPTRQRSAPATRCPAPPTGTGAACSPAPSAALLGVVLATVPVILAVEFTNSVPAAVRIPVLVVGAAGYGLALAWAGARIAARAAERQLPELYGLAVRSKL